MKTTAAESENVFIKLNDTLGWRDDSNTYVGLGGEGALRLPLTVPHLPVQLCLRKDSPRPTSLSKAMSGLAAGMSLLCYWQYMKEDIGSLCTIDSQSQCVLGARVDETFVPETEPSQPPLFTVRLSDICITNLHKIPVANSW